MIAVYHGSLPLTTFPRSGAGFLLYISYASEIDSLLTATSMLGHQYVDDVQATLLCF